MSSNKKETYKQKFDNDKEKLEGLIGANSKIYPHAKKYLNYNYVRNSGKDKFIFDKIKEYNIYLEEIIKIEKYWDNRKKGAKDSYIFNVNNLKKITKRLNKYYTEIADHAKHFKPQSKFRSSILEELMVLIFRSYLKCKYANIDFGKISCYSNLYFLSDNTISFINDQPKYAVNLKEQDFAIFKSINITIGANKREINVPLVAVENKTYIDKTMFESSVATAYKIKQGNPYCLYIIVVEEYAIDEEVDPVFSDIDQIYVLRKSKRTKKKTQTNTIQNEIDHKVLHAFYKRVIQHLDGDINSVKERIKKGVIISE